MIRTVVLALTIVCLVTSVVGCEKNKWDHVHKLEGDQCYYGNMRWDHCQANRLDNHPYCGKHKSLVWRERYKRGQDADHLNGLLLPNDMTEDQWRRYIDSNWFGNVVKQVRTNLRWE